MSNYHGYGYGFRPSGYERRMRRVEERRDARERRRAMRRERLAPIDGDGYDDANHAPGLYRGVGRWIWDNRLSLFPAYVGAGVGVGTGVAASSPVAGVALTVAAGAGSYQFLGRVPEAMTRSRRVVIGSGAAYTGVLAGSTAGLTASPLMSWLLLAVAGVGTLEWRSTDTYRRLREVQRLREQWPQRAAELGVAGYTLRRPYVKMLDHGVTYHVTAPPGELPAKRIDRERVASVFSTRREWVNVAESERNPRNVDLTVYTSNPWAGRDNRHPAEIGEGAWAAPSRSITEPQPIGVPAGSLQDGQRYALVEVCAKASGRARQINVGGMRGSGKSVLENGLIASVLSCCDALVMMIDVPKKGVEGRDWGPGAVTVCVKTYHHADMLLEALLALAEHRNANRWRPGPDTPLILLVIDELKSLLQPESAANAAYGEIITEKLEALSRLAGAAGIATVLATQRPTNDAFGNSTVLREQGEQGVCLRLRKTEDSKYVLGHETDVDIGRWTDEGLFVGTSPYMNSDQVWRGFDLSPVLVNGELENVKVQEIGRRYAVGRPAIEPDGVDAMNEALALWSAELAERNGGEYVEFTYEDDLVYIDGDDDEADDGEGSLEMVEHDEDETPVVGTNAYERMTRVELAEHARTSRASIVVPDPLRLDDRTIGDPDTMPDDEREMYEQIHSPEGQRAIEEAGRRYVPEGLTRDDLALYDHVTRAGVEGVRLANLPDEFGTRAARWRSLDRLREHGYVSRVGDGRVARWVAVTAPPSST